MPNAMKCEKPTVEEKCFVCSVPKVCHADKTDCPSHVHATGYYTQDGQFVCSAGCGEMLTQER
ncbi:MAG: hypothetical protein ACM3KM_03815 [Acidobacteriaceae bacterium]